MIANRTSKGQLGTLSSPSRCSACPGHKLLLVLCMILDFIFIRRHKVDSLLSISRQKTGSFTSWIV
jgi:hypothetical protein